MLSGTCSQYIPLWPKARVRLAILMSVQAAWLPAAATFSRAGRADFPVSVIRLDLVADILREVASDLILPAYRNLDADSVREKTAGDLVTVIDEQVEAALAVRLPALLPGSLFIGEEAVHHNPALLKGLGADYVWLADPLDGTRNFVTGSPHFAIMVALLQRGEAVASWIYAPVLDQLIMAERGGGVFVYRPDAAGRQSDRIQLPPREPTDDLAGVVYSRYMPEDIRQWLLPRTVDHFRTHRPRGAAAAEYPRVLQRDVDFLLYWRTLPWDHIPGALMVNEAGGVARRPDGRAYTALDSGAGLLVASDADAWEQVRRQLELMEMISRQS